MFQKLFVVVVSALVLCPQVEAATYTFTSPAAGTVWTTTATVNASGSTNAPGGDKIKVSFGYGAGGVLYIENDVTHTVVGTVSGPNMWMAGVPAPTCWWWFCTPGWRKSPVLAVGPPVILLKDGFVEVKDHPAVAGSERYRNDQGVN